MVLLTKAGPNWWRRCLEPIHIPQVGTWSFSISFPETIVHRRTCRKRRIVTSCYKYIVKKLYPMVKNAFSRDNACIVHALFLRFFRRWMRFRRLPGIARRGNPTARDSRKMVAVKSTLVDDPASS